MHTHPIDVLLSPRVQGCADGRRKVASLLGSFLITLTGIPTALAVKCASWNQQPERRKKADRQLNQDGAGDDDDMARLYSLNRGEKMQPCQSGKLVQFMSLLFRRIVVL